MLGIISAVALLALSVPVVFRYRILPVDGTPYWLFGILFFVLLFNLLLSFFPHVVGKKLQERIKTLFLWTTLTIVLGGTMVTAMVDRSKTAPVYGVHDIILQQEAAMRFFLGGKNPYKETYFGTPLASFNYDEPGNPDAINPALYHFVMPPWYLLFPFGFYFVSIPLLGYFDGRMPLLFTAFALLVLISRWFKSKDLGAIAIIFTALSPATVDFVIEGRSDFFALFWFIWALFLLEKKRVFVSAIVFALAIASKQTIWFSAPFYLAYLWWTVERTKVWQSMALALGTVLLVAGPFLLWDANAFLESTVFYLSGNAQRPYPVSGYGWGMVLWSMGVIADLHAQYPFVLWQVAVGFPVLLVFLRLLKKKTRLSYLLLGYASFLFVVWYFSRYFNNSHLGYLSSVFVLGGLKMLDEEHHD